VAWASPVAKVTVVARRRFGYAAGMDTRFARHIAACNNANLPGERIAFAIGTTPVGWVRPDVAQALAGLPAMTVTATAATLAADAAGTLPAIGRALADQGFCRWRGEAFDVRADGDGPVLATLDRGALPALGVLAVGAHLNGLVRRPEGLHLWVARRAADKALDPGKLDHLVAGGVAAGMTPRQTLVKEAAEEAGMPAALAGTAVETGVVSYAMERPEGLRRDRLVCYDVMLPAGFQPVATDGEVAGFELWPMARVVERVRDTDDFKFNVNLVLIALFQRLGLA
jgi:8-oxo-dGTP pyrophosphatase MutT (NUDIX family)